MTIHGVSRRCGVAQGFWGQADRQVLTVTFSLSRVYGLVTSTSSLTTGWAWIPAGSAMTMSEPSTIPTTRTTKTSDPRVTFC
ncbi:hypothetical protein [Methylacidiphilum sp. Yel]|uniref:hypothetical protein n=1 Tax=Methylacidiphilum sp. Yel TaxID=1847730 RepID=UPI00106A9E06|nr:hypothetical protein [Methylacidiphilum sp. Yel]